MEFGPTPADLKRQRLIDAWATSTERQRMAMLGVVGCRLVDNMAAVPLFTDLPDRIQQRLIGWWE